MTANKYIKTLADKYAEEDSDIYIDLIEGSVGMTKGEDGLWVMIDGYAYDTLCEDMLDMACALKEMLDGSI